MGWGVGERQLVWGWGRSGVKIVFDREVWGVERPLEVACVPFATTVAGIILAAVVFSCAPAGAGIYCLNTGEAEGPEAA